MAKLEQRQGDLPGESEPTIPYPPRFWWMKRIVLGRSRSPCCSAHYGCGGDGQANRRLDEMLAPLRAAGEPTTATELAASFPDVPDTENAVFHLREAIAAMVPGVDSPAQSMLEYRGYPPFPRLGIGLPMLRCSPNRATFIARGRHVRTKPSTGNWTCKARCWARC